MIIRIKHQKFKAGIQNHKDNPYSKDILSSGQFFIGILKWYPYVKDILILSILLARLHCNMRLVTCELLGPPLGLHS
jgi:hypothetical protein